MRRMSQTHLAHWGEHWLRANTSFGRQAPASMAWRTSRSRMPLQLQTYKAEALPESGCEWIAYTTESPQMQLVLKCKP